MRLEINKTTNEIISRNRSHIIFLTIVILYTKVKTEYINVFRNFYFVDNKHNQLACKP